MAIKTFDELMETIRERTKDMTDDETVQFIEDVSDTLKNYESMTAENADWKQKYEYNDSEWRKRYTERFFTGVDDNDKVIDNPPENNIDETPKTFEDLFTTE